MNSSTINSRKRVLALIPARGGSKGLPRKNILMVKERPLISWTIEAALKSKVITRTILSTDDDEIAGIAASWGCEVPFKRPPQLATDSASSIDVVLHAIQQLPGYDFVILLQPTSPLRLSSDIDFAFEHMLEKKGLCCVSVCESEQSPYWMYQINSNGELEKLLPVLDAVTRRQDLPPTYVLNGAIYIARVDWLLKSKSFIGSGCIPYAMPKKRSLDIDTVEDLNLFSSIFYNHNDC
jgi:N-acylneuraminate cytidylyltransferase